MFDTNQLRLIIAGAVILVLLVILWTGRERRAKPPRPRRRVVEVAPQPQTTGLVARRGRVEAAGVAASVGDLRAERGEAVPPRLDTHIVALSVMSPDALFSGPDIARVLEAQGLVHGDRSIYHRYAESRRAPVFSVANAVEPGTFDARLLGELRTPGLMLFVQLPGPVDARAAFESMYGAARVLAESLGGVVCDVRRVPLGPERLDELRAEVEGCVPHATMAE